MDQNMDKEKIVELIKSIEFQRYILTLCEYKIYSIVHGVVEENETILFLDLSVIEEWVREKKEEVEVTLEIVGDELEDYIRNSLEEEN